MKTSMTAALIFASIAGFAGAANADLVNGTITADNHYALYSSQGNVFSYHGGNEITSGGNPGTYNWSQAEPYQFEVGEFLYIAAWSDDSVAQGVLAEFHSDALGTLMSGDSRWEVYGSNLNRNDGDPHPDIFEIANHVGVADANMLWEPIFVGDANGVQPWGTIAGVSDDAHWMWRSDISDADPLNGGSGNGEMLIFRTNVPTPGSAAFLGIGGLAFIRRRR